jgi:hypothetical protein
MMIEIILKMFRNLPFLCTTLSHTRATSCIRSFLNSSPLFSFPLAPCRPLMSLFHLSSVSSSSNFLHEIISKHFTYVPVSTCSTRATYSPSVVVGTSYCLLQETVSYYRNCSASWSPVSSKFYVKWSCWCNFITSNFGLQSLTNYQGVQFCILSIGSS